MSISIIPTEHQEQSLVIQYCNLRKIPIFHIPNGSYKSLTARVRAKKEGLVSGIPDLMIPIANKEFNGLFIEMKRVKNSKVSVQQLQWIELLKNQGYKAIVCYGSKQAIEEIESYIKG
ncbi:VRR-NUC domain-containing protein [Arcobacter lanthieri]|uniref:VRR-NUC domain-containing protein n=1 Tax=Aliarcobacter lanthieri TaxID=1355374 RepID=UPI0019207190|nr:VRR-NUC domain-containing protein [Aliarcobacter lanthieri]MBL3520290.1 VRR-NUC domain-containing protein [Aliarcobacter lanthieri]